MELRLEQCHRSFQICFRLTAFALLASIPRASCFFVGPELFPGSLNSAKCPQVASRAVATLEDFAQMLAEDEPQRKLVPMYSFGGSDTERVEALAQFERIDDVIMGGLSKSQLTEGPGHASWRGLIRTDGGGFCGQRTRPFTRPLNLTGADGLYIRCRLASDQDVDRRVWKLTLRTNEGRGEVVYQAPYKVQTGSAFKTVFVPFSDFVLVRGPVAIPNAPRVSNVSAIYQIGFTCSKFMISSQMTPLDNFRNGTFQLDISELGAFSGSLAKTFKGDTSVLLSDAEVKRKKPLVLKLLLPVIGLVFSEARRRKRRASQLLQNRGASRFDLLRFGWRFKRHLASRSIISSLGLTGGQVAAGSAAAVLGAIARGLVFPVVRLLSRRRRQKEEQGAV